MNASSPEVIARYGIIASSPVAFNDVIKISGRVPGKKEIIRILKEVS